MSTFCSQLRKKKSFMGQGSDCYEVDVPYP